MPWVIDRWYMQGWQDGVVTVLWWCKDNENAGVMKKGQFEHTLVGSDTWDTNKAAIETKITAEEGMET